MYLLICSCTVFSSNSKKERFEPTFKAEINGELYDMNQFESHLTLPIAGTTSANGVKTLQIFCYFYSKDLYPYKESISMNIVPWSDSSGVFRLDGDITYYNQDHYWIRRGSYRESDGDAAISSFLTPKGDQGFVTVNKETLSDGREVVYGNFEYIVVENYLNEEVSQRVGQDTLHITNGEYRLLLDDRRNE